MGDILTAESDWASVRRLIDVTLTPDLLPDAAIQDLMFLGMAEAEVLRRVPDALLVDQTAARAATIYLTAALLIPAVPRIVSESHGDLHQYSREPSDMALTVAEFRDKADQLLVGMGTEATEADDAPFPHFVLGHGTRGWG